MNVSIITSVWNGAATIETAIQSVLEQTYSNIEYIVIDGASTDGTMDILQKYSDNISVLVSEPDDGIYDALNKGVALATGDVIAFLHSDDLYANKTVVEEVANQFVLDETLDGIYGDLIYTSKDDLNNVYRYWKSRAFDKKLLKKGWMPAHPTLFLRKSIYNKMGNFDTSFKIAADYDFMLRVLKENFNIHYCPILLYKMRIGGASNKSIKNLFKKSREDYFALKKNNVGGIRTLFYKNISKIRQFFHKGV